jgi:hypothetical protein
MSHSTISLGLGLGGGKASTSSGRPAGSSFANDYSVHFDGANDYLKADAGSALRSTSAISFSQWVNFDTVGSTQKGFSLGNPSSLDDRIQYYINFAGTVVVYIKLGGVAVSKNSSTGVISAGSWFHIVVTLDNTNGIKIYVNGNHEATQSVSAGYLSSNSNLTEVRMSARATSLSQFVDGKIDETSVYATTLSASDVTDIYNSGVPTDLSAYSPVHWWRFGDNDGGTGTTLTDQGSAGENATLYNGPTFSSDVPS